MGERQSRTALKGEPMKKTMIIAAIAVVAAAAAAAAFVVARKYVLPARIVGELKVIAHSPEGEGVPISMGGISVMFDHAVVPLTTIDAGRGSGVTLNVSPSIGGKLTWLGTHGFLFRPDEPLPPATTYHVELPAGLVSIEGYRLEAPLAWDFVTVAPMLRSFDPAEGQMLLPRSAIVAIHFNIAMDKGDVESKLAVVDAESHEAIKARPTFTWEDDDHLLTLRFKEELPWGTKIKVVLPKGVRGAKGDVGTKEDASATYEIPQRELTIERVEANDVQHFESDRRIPLIAGKRQGLAPGSGVCFLFSQPIEKKSFEAALHVETAGAPRKAAKSAPYYYFEQQEGSPTIGEKGEMKYREGYRSGCAAFLDAPGAVYDFSIDPAKIVSLSGAKLAGGGEKYSVLTRHAEPSVRALLTKNILSLNGPMKIPYRAVNVSSIRFNLYRWEKPEEYSEQIKSARVEALDKHASPPLSMPLASRTPPGFRTRSRAATACSGCSSVSNRLRQSTVSKEPWRASRSAGVAGSNCLTQTLGVRRKRLRSACRYNGSFSQAT